MEDKNQNQIQQQNTEGKAEEQPTQSEANNSEQKKEETKAEENKENVREQISATESQIKKQEQIIKNEEKKVEQTKQEEKKVEEQKQKKQEKQEKQEKKQAKIEQASTKQQQLQSPQKLISPLEAATTPLIKNIPPPTISISVTQTQIKGTGLTKYSVYLIEGSDDHGNFEVLRKYKEFASLRKILLERWPGCFVPGLTDKSDIKNNEQRDKHVRRVLTNFLIGLSYSPHLYYKQEIQHFLRSPDLQSTQLFESMPILKTPDVMNRYLSFFGEQVEGPSQAKNAKDVHLCMTALKKILNGLDGMKFKALKLAELYESYTNKLGKFGQGTRTYEQLSLAQFTDNTRQKSILIKDEENRIDKLLYLPAYNPFYQLYTHIEVQSRDVQSFLDVVIAIQLFLLRRDELITEIKELQIQIDQIALGQMTMRTMTTRKSKEQVQADMQNKQKKLVQDKHSVEQMFRITQIVLAKRQIAIFKRFKRDSYRKILQQWFKVVGSISTDVQDVWRFVNLQAKEMLSQCQQSRKLKSEQK